MAPILNCLFLSIHGKLGSANHDVRFNVNLQDGGTMYTTGTGNIADINIQHSSTYQSKLNLPGNNPVLSVDNPNEKVLEIYPNPTNNNLKIENIGDYKTYEIIDLLGKKVGGGLLNTNFISVDYLENGRYFITLCDSEGNKLSESFIKR